MPTGAISGYSLRRGGATWYFMATGSMARTTVHGRWAAEGTARIYIDGAMAQMSRAHLPPESERVLRAAAAIATAVLAAQADEQRRTARATRVGRP